MTTNATTLEQRILSAAEPFLGLRASTVLNAVCVSLMKRPLADLGLDQVGSLAYWARIVISTSDVDIVGSVADLERSIRGVQHDAPISAVNREVRS